MVEIIVIIVITQKKREDKTSLLLFNLYYRSFPLRSTHKRHL